MNRRSRYIGASIVLLLLSSLAGADLDVRDIPRNRIVSVLSHDATGRVTRCLGYTLATDWIVTAKHCSSTSPETTVLIRLGMTLPVLSVDAHPVLDLALLRIEGGPAFSFTRFGKVVGGSYHVFGVQDAGWPIEETSSRYPSEGTALVYEMSRGWVRVQTGSYRKPCLGDSGGPLISLAGEFDGILSRGSLLCSGRDEYVIPDQKWLQQSIECRCSPHQEEAAHEWL
jgi:hypothetical protein